MNQKIIDFINSQRICVFAIEMMDGSPHASTLHFATSENPLTFFFKTSRTYRNSESLLGKDVARASLVVGFDENNMKTLQLDGHAKVVKTDEEKELFEAAYYGKFTDKTKKDSDPDSLYFSFTPTWWRYTDWTGPNGKEIISSDKI
jgi:general stress protein 26